MDARIIAAVNGRIPDGILELDLSLQALPEALQEDPFEEFPDLTAFPNLTRLEIRNHALEFLDGLEVLQKLAHLDLSFNRLDSAEETLLLPRLESLNLNHNDLRGISTGPSLPRLKSLALSGNPRLRSLEFLSSMPNLEVLYLKALRVNSFEPLQYLPKLRELYMAPFQPSDIMAMQHNLALETLHISSPTLTLLPEFPSLPNLKRLSITKCPYLAEADAVRHLGTVEELNLAHNDLENVDFLVEMTNLRSVDLRGNLIQRTPRLAELGEWVEVRWEETPDPT